MDHLSLTCVSILDPIQFLDRTSFRYFSFNLPNFIKNTFKLLHPIVGKVFKFNFSWRYLLHSYKHSATNSHDKSIDANHEIMLG
jgi:CRISPR/Cas system-associated protein Cas10 (large subunit of type III CRISPR-Cas system)